MDHKVYIILGFHTNFYHSWRGDTPDEAGFGTDIRIVREILRMLNDAGETAKAYWDTDVYFTFEGIIPQHAPDILEGIRARVDAGLDEIVLGSYNNGANHAATTDELNAALAWGIENPWGSGLKQLFGEMTPYCRPQETMISSGQEAIYRKNGIECLFMYYAYVAFNTLSAFTPALSLEQRFNPLWLRTQEDTQPILLFPCISPPDLIEHVSLENLMLDLHQAQRKDQINSDVAIHINFDADAETWLPMNVPPILSWFPNTGGLEEYIRMVDKYPWAAFCLPSEYLASHPPNDEILVHQDMADGGFDGNYSWAEKYTSLGLWTTLERSRLASYRVAALAKRIPAQQAEAVRECLWEGVDSSFFQRLVGLSTTHFGMSTPVLNEERQARAWEILGAAEQIAQESERQAATQTLELHPSQPDLYTIEVYNFPRGRDAQPEAASGLARIPVILPAGVRGVTLRQGNGPRVPASLVNLRALGEDRTAAEIWFPLKLEGEERQVFHISQASDQTPHEQPDRSLSNRWMEIRFDETNGISEFLFEGRLIGGSDFLKPLISYRSGEKPRTYLPDGFSFLPLADEDWEGLQRIRLLAEVPFQTPNGPVTSRFEYTFTLLDELPYLWLDVSAQYAYTQPQDLIHTIQQKLRRLIDLRWVEVAPCQIHPAFTASLENPLKVWKHNWSGVTSYYDLNYGQINPRNRQLDSFNHQVTAGWVGVTDREAGLLLAQNTEILASMAFCPMRLRQEAGEQHIYLNPFGSYYGKQLDYAHLGGNGIGAELTCAFSSALHPNGPSFNGQRLDFSLLLAPYLGDAPPAATQRAAMTHFYPFGVVYCQTPEGIDALLPEDLRREVEKAEIQIEMASTEPLPIPTAFLANPSDRGADLVWDATRDRRLTGYQLQWRWGSNTEWQSTIIEPGNRWHLDGLENDQEYSFRLRAISGELTSNWTAPSTCIPGSVAVAPLASTARNVPLWTFVRLVGVSLRAVLRAWWHGRG